MRRAAALCRKTPLSRGRPLARRTRLRRVNHARIRARRAVQFGAQAQLCRELPCLICGRGPCDPHHVRSRGAGGRDEHTVPLCEEHHHEFHDIGRHSFDKRYGVDLLHEAARLHEQVARGMVAA